MDHGDNKHCIETAWSNWYHYKASDEGHMVACGVQDNPTCVQLRGKGSYPTIDFEMPRQRHDLEKVDLLMHQSYIRGQQDQKRAIGQMMRDLVAL